MFRMSEFMTFHDYSCPKLAIFMTFSGICCEHNCIFEYTGGCTQEYIMECLVDKGTTPTLYCRSCENILNLIWIFSLHFDICLLDFVALAYATKRRLAIGNS